MASATLRPTGDGDPGSWSTNFGPGIPIWDKINGAYSYPSTPADTTWVTPSDNADNCEIGFDLSSVPLDAVISNVTVYCRTDAIGFFTIVFNSSSSAVEVIGNHWESVILPGITNYTQLSNALSPLLMSVEDGSDMPIYYNLYVAVTYTVPATSGLVLAGKVRHGVTLQSGVNI